MSEKNLQLIVPIDIYYTNKNHVSIKDVIKSLEGIDALTNHFHSVASQILGANVSSSSATIENIQSGSLLEKIFISLNFKNDEELEKALNKFGQDHPLLKYAINIAFVSVFLYGLYSAVKSNGGDTTHIEGNNNVNITINQPGLTSEEISKIIDKAIVDKKAVANAAVKMAAPAKSDKQAEIRFKVNGSDDSTAYVITPQAIAEVTDYYKPVIEEKILSISSASVSIRATDLDKRTQGWAGLIDGIDHRLPITIAPNVDVNKLKDTSIVDVQIIYKKNANDDNLRPTRIFIEKISSNTSHINLAKKQLTQDEADRIDSIETSKQFNLNLSP